MVTLIPLHAQVQRGRATFYSKRATGARTASGERLHHDSLTCAHRTLPFGTLIKVTNVDNDKEVVVKVTDRGPFARGRIIDLSWSAAQELGIIAQGVGNVKLEVVGFSDDFVVPYKASDRIELPQIDFDVADAGYSVIEEWRDRQKQEPVLPKETTDTPAPTKMETKAERTPPGKLSRHRKGVDKNSLKRQNNTKTEKKKDEDNVWNRIFKKVKGIGDIF